MLANIADLLNHKPKDPEEAPAGFLFANGKTVPADGTAGYATGCLFQHTDGGDGTAFYVNEGTATSADFNLIQIAGASEVTAAMIAAGAVTTAKILGANVTPAKLVGTGFAAAPFDGRNGAGSCTLTGATVGQRVLCGWLSGDVSDRNTKGQGTLVTQAAFSALFEGAITVADQIQQTSATDLSDNVYTVILIPASS